MLENGKIFEKFVLLGLYRDVEEIKLDGLFDTLRENGKFYCS